MKTIVVAVDVSPRAYRVVDALQTLNLDPEPTVVLSYVLPTDGTDEDVPVDIPNRARSSEQKLIEAEKFLLELSQQMGEVLAEAVIDLAIELEVVTGDPAEEIVRLAGIYDADTIVLGSRNLKGVNRVIQGSVSSQVVESASCSVYVVKSNGEV